MVIDDINKLVGQTVTISITGRQVSGRLARIEARELVVVQGEKALRFAAGYCYKVIGNTIYSL